MDIDEFHKWAFEAKTDKDLNKWLIEFERLGMLCIFCGFSKRKTKRYMWHFWEARKANDLEAVERLCERIIEDSIVFGEGKKI